MARAAKFVFEKVMKIHFKEVYTIFYFEIFDLCINNVVCHCHAVCAVNTKKNDLLSKADI